MSIIVKSLIKITLSGFLLLSTGLCFPQTQPKATKAAPAASAPAPAQDANLQPKPAEDEVIPAAAPNALFPAVVARVNGKAILGRDLEDRIRRELSSIGNPEWNNLREDYRGQLVLSQITALINSRLLYQKAIAGGTKVTEAEVQAELDKIAKSYKSDAEMNAALASQNTDRAALQKSLYETLAIAKFVEETINKKIAVTPEELSKFYSSNPTQFNHPDIVRISHILIQPAGDTAQQDSIAQGRAEALLARVKKGEDFAKLAKENSVDGSASQGGDAGFVTKNNIAPEYAEAAFSLPVGSVKLIKTEFGYHIIKITDRKKEGLATLEEVKQDLTDFLKNQKAQEELVKLVNQLRDGAKIEILIPAGQPLTP
jgi:peptidyl-prolyl cis-trans isomerase C